MLAQVLIGVRLAAAEQTHSSRRHVLVCLGSIRVREATGRALYLPRLAVPQEALVVSPLAPIRPNLRDDGWTMSQAI